MTKYERHIRSLCKKHKIKVFYVDRKYCCNVYTKEAWLPKQIRTLRRYAIAMHEVCHIINERPHIRRNFWKDAWEVRRNKNTPFVTRFTLEKEIEAWKVAAKQAKWWGPEADKVASFALSSYIACYDDCHKTPVISDNKILDSIAEFWTSEKMFLKTVLPK